MYLAIADKQGVAWDRLGGTMQNDMLKEFIAQKEWICPPEPAVRIVTDMIEFTSKHVPRFNPVSISGYHIREAGSTAVQELAFTLADGLGYVEAALARGLDVDSLRAAPVVLLRHPQRLLRGDRQAAGGPADLGPLHEGALRGEEAGVDAAAHAHADRRRVGHRPAAAQQRGAGGAAGAGRGAGRRPVAAHQLLRRDVGAAHRGGGDRRAAHAAAHRRGDRRAADDRSAGRLLLSGEDDRPDGGGRARVHRADRRHGRHGAGHRRGLSRRRRSPTPPTATSSWTTAARRSRWA